MNKLLKKQPAEELTGMHDKITGTPCPDLYGDVRGLRGDVSGLLGDVSGLYGKVSGLRGNVSGLRGKCTNIEGNIDECGLTDEEREKNVDINDLVIENILTKYK